MVKILTVDIGTGTQDILLFNSRLSIENGYKLILPSPTMMIRSKIHQALEEHRNILLSGVLMGGGPCAWAVSDLLQAGLKVYATAEAAQTMDDDLEKVSRMGVNLVSADEAQNLPSEITRIEMKDFDFNTIAQAFAYFGVSLSDLDALAVAVFDHGNAPADVSDRRFRFDYLERRIRENNHLSAFAYERSQIPSFLTRMKAVAQSAASLQVPLVVMDTAPAAVLGASFDARPAQHPRRMIVNLGNMHTLAFRLAPGGIEGVFEHHTPMLNQAKLEGLLCRFAEGTLTNQQVFEDHGHGALLLSTESFSLDDPELDLIFTGPRRGLMNGSQLKLRFAAPFGDMMLSGCYGLLAAVADILPELAEPILSSLKNHSYSGTEPWNLV